MSKSAPSNDGHHNAAPIETAKTPPSAHGRSLRKRAVASASGPLGTVGSNTCSVPMAVSPTETQGIQMQVEQAQRLA